MYKTSPNGHKTYQMDKTSPNGHKTCQLAVKCSEWVRQGQNERCFKNGCTWSMLTLKMLQQNPIFSAI
jgi:hypothetical protein